MHSIGVVTNVICYSHAIEASKTGVELVVNSREWTAMVCGAITVELHALTYCSLYASELCMYLYIPKGVERGFVENFFNIIKKFKFLIVPRGDLYLQQ